VGVEEFTNGNGWRYPFLLSIVLVIVSIIIRLKMKESPMFSKLKKEGKTSSNPLKESFGHKENFKMVLLALFGATMGQGVIWYTSQFYAQNFILTKCNIEYEQGNSIILIAILLATPFFILFGHLSDKIGRKNIMLAGMLLGVLLYRPIFNELYNIADTTKKIFVSEQNIQPKISALNNLIAINSFEDGTTEKITTKLNTDGKATQKKEIVLAEKGKWTMILLVFVMVLFVTMVYGPIAAFLVELFPTRIRYTSMSLPYHIGNGVFGGLVPFIATLITTLPGTNVLSGLWYPIGVALLCFVIGSLYLSNKLNHSTDE
jgi:MHS family proline/betaine transporter-like MFS transporter